MKKLMDRTWGPLAAALLLATPFTASAAMVYFDPTPKFAQVGDTFSVDLIYDGMGASYLGDFDVDITFNTSIVSYGGATFGVGLDAFGLGTLAGDFDLGGTIDLFEISFDAPADLMAHQDGLGNSFVLASLEFTALAVGETDLTFTQGVFGNELGQPKAVDPVDGKIIVRGISTVPEPSSMLLLGLSLLGLGLRRRQA